LTNVLINVECRMSVLDKGEMEIKNSVTLGDKKSIVEKIITEFRNALITKALKPGDKVPTEMELAHKFSVSRGMVREAAKILVALGVLEIRRGEGTYVVKNVSAPVMDPLIFHLLLTGGIPDELLELREMLEIGILEIVLEKITDEDIGKMERTIERLQEDCRKKETDREILRKHDLDFHYAFANATHNALVIKIARTVWEMFSASIEGSVNSRTEDAVRKHRMILEGLKERSLKKTKKAIYLSLEEWRKDLDRLSEKSFP